MFRFAKCIKLRYPTKTLWPQHKVDSLKLGISMKHGGMDDTAAGEDKAWRHLDLAVIGAGIYGIQAARTYLHLHPDHNVLIFEASDHIGGVWSAARMYDTFWTQTPLRILEFSDMRLEDVPESDTRYGFFAARHVTRYLEAYIATRTYAEKSLASRVTLRSRVSIVGLCEDGWRLCVDVSMGGSKQQVVYTARKVIDATGLTSTPNMPSILNQDIFRGTVIHHKDFGTHQESLLAKTGPQKILVVGGAKSAADVAYASAKAGKDVTWVIRKSGSGPANFVAPHGRGIYKNSNESFYTRLVSYFLASFFMDEYRTLLGRFLHRTSLGHGLLGRVWSNINSKAHADADYYRTDGKANGFFNLRPDLPIFWQNDSTGIRVHDDFFDTIAKLVQVHRKDIACFTETGVKLANGDVIEANAVICATGWKTSHPKYLFEKGDVDLFSSFGLPVPKQSISPEDSDKWNSLENIATKEILHRFPILRNPFVQNRQSSSEDTPIRLYKGILPIENRSIAFLGQMMLGNHFRAAEVQALYAVAAMDGYLKLPEKSEMEMSVARMVTWCRLRYLSKGDGGNWIYWDLVPYTDNLLRELGLVSHLHKTWWKNLLSPCFAADLTGLLEEYSNKYRDSSI